MLMKSYEQRMETSGIADRIALLAHEHLVRMYERMGFVDKGRSPVRFGGGGWTSLVDDHVCRLTGSKADHYPLDIRLRRTWSRYDLS